MLYVFLVASGTMMTFDMNLAMKSVYCLQKAIEQACAIPEEQQVLLISGGIALKKDCVVSRYSAGTDTNPIFLFTMTGEDIDCESYAQDEINSYMNMEERVKACENMAPDYQTLAARSQLARDLSDLSNHEFTLCNQLVDAQHLQQQGWSALAANLEDHAKNMKRAFESFESEVQRYFEARPLYENLLNSFPSAVDKLDKVPLLPVFLSETDDKDARHTLLTKYAAGPTTFLLELADRCKKWIDQLSEGTMSSIRSMVHKLLSFVADPSIKEIVGIEDRLFKLNEMLQDAQRNAAEQNKYAESLCAHHNRISSINDHSILNDLCRTHQMQLKIMLEHHKRLMETREKCMKAKAELSENLKKRIVMVASNEQQIFNLENQFALYREHLNRLNFHLNLIEQMHLAPEVYIRTLVEIRRRKCFSTNFLKWASNLSEQSSELHKKEVNLRKTFNSTYPSHLFLCDLFPGMADLPPPFATKCPEPFDVLLPNVTQEDLEKLKKLLPEFASLIEVPPPDVMPHTSHKSTVSDSAFSSEVPSSQGIGGPSHSSTSFQSGQLFRTETSSSLGAGEGAGLVPEVFSPTSSPFEDPFQPAAEVEVPIKFSKSGKTKKLDDSGLECKKIHLTETGTEKEMFSPIAEEQNTESDGDEFERVDNVPKSYDPFVTSAANVESKQIPESEKISRSNTEITGTYSDALQAQVEELQLSPSEGLRSPESNVTSHDFHSADYFIDDSMPSSYTESTGLSALGKNQHLVKSHHVIVAELQHQLTDKGTALTSSHGSLRVSRSADKLKMHATISALQKFIQDLRVKLLSDLKNLRESVVVQRLTYEDEASAIIDRINASVSAMQSQAEVQKASAVEEAVRQEREIYEKLLLKKNEELEVEVQKLRDANHEIEIYQEQIFNFKIMLDERKHEYDSHFRKAEKEHASHIEELKRCLTLEHESELESIQEETKQKFQERDDKISKLMEELALKQSQIQMLAMEKQNLEVELEEKLAKEREQWTEIINSQQVTKVDVAVQNDETLWQGEEHLMAESDHHENMEEYVQASIHDEKNDALSTLFQDKQLFEQLSSELYRIWCAVRADIGEIMPSEELHRSFIDKMKVYVEQVMEEKMLMESHGEHLQEQMEQERQDYLYMMQLLKDIRQDLDCIFKSYKQSCSYKDFLSLSSKNYEMCEKLKQAIKAFRNFDATLKYYKNLIRELKDKQKEQDLEKETLRMKVQEDHQRHQEDIEKLKSLHMAESQVSFNEAVHRVTREKDEVISALMSEVSMLQRNHEMVKSVIGSYMEQPGASWTESSQCLSVEQSQVITRTLSEIKAKIEQPGPLFHSVGALDTSSSSLVQKVKKLEKALRKEKEKLQRVYETVSKSSHVKLSLLTCNPGDIVLFYYSQKHNNYVAFHFGSITHFLHTDGLQVLDLKIPPDNTSTSWAIGVVTDKDYCLAKKKPNRYNVKHGSVFYCVKVEAWEKGKELRQMVQPGLSSAEVPPPFQLASEGTAGEASTSGHMSASTI